MNPATDSFAEAREHQWLHKPHAMSAMAAAICRLALAREKQEFSANDLTLADHGGTGICGSIFKRLAADEVIEPVMLAPSQQKMARNPGGNPIGLWRLHSAARAQRLIELHAARPDPKLLQTELTV